MSPEITPLHSILEHGENEDTCKDLVEDEEIVAIREANKNKKESVGKVVAVALSASSSSQAASAGSSSTSKPPVRANIDWENIQIEVVRKYLPAEAKCHMSREFTHCTRWKAAYPNPEPPRSFNMVYRDKAGEQQSVVACLEWLWQSHTQATGMACPWVWRCILAGLR